MVKPSAERNGALSSPGELRIGPVRTGGVHSQSSEVSISSGVGRLGAGAIGRGTPFGTRRTL